MSMTASVVANHPASPSNAKPTNEMATSFILEKPSQPPPSVPIRPPPIGFNVALLEEMSVVDKPFMNELPTAPVNAPTTSNSTPLGNASSSIASSSILSTSMSSTSSSSQEMLNNSPNNTPTINSTIATTTNNSNSNNIKTKPAVPPKRLHGNNIAAQISKFEQIKNGSASDDHLVDESESPKAPSEITSL